MPELPEVETVRRQLEKKILNKKIVQIKVLKPKITKSNPDFTATLEGLKFTALKRRAKLLIFETSNPNLFMLGHLKMTGQFIACDAESNLSGGGHTLSASDLNLPHKHTRVIYTFEDNSTLFFNDMRMFGYNVLATKSEVETTISKYGIEPNTSNYTWDNFQKIFERRKVAIKGLLLNQNAIAGLGNIYVDETLFRAGIHPERPAHKITLPEKKKLFTFAATVLQESVDMGGTTFYNFMDAEGRKGNYYDVLQVFDRTGELCIHCETPIEKIRVATRGTHFCPKCQK